MAKAADRRNPPIIPHFELVHGEVLAQVDGDRASYRIRPAEWVRLKGETKPGERCGLSLEQWNPRREKWFDMFVGDDVVEWLLGGLREYLARRAGLFPVTVRLVDEE